MYTSASKKNTPLPQNRQLGHISVATGRIPSLFCGHSQSIVKHKLAFLHFILLSNFQLVLTFVKEKSQAKANHACPIWYHCGVVTKSPDKQLVIKLFLSIKYTMFHNHSKLCINTSINKE